MAKGKLVSGRKMRKERRSDKRNGREKSTLDEKKAEPGLRLLPDCTFFAMEKSAWCVRKHHENKDSWGGRRRGRGRAGGLQSEASRLFRRHGGGWSRSAQESEVG